MVCAGGCLCFWEGAGQSLATGHLSRLVAVVGATPSPEKIIPCITIVLRLFHRLRVLRELHQFIIPQD
jgi:hypothetical protein